MDHNSDRDGQAGQRSPSEQSKDFKLEVDQELRFEVENEDTVGFIAKIDCYN
jgi:hypothetical protein